MFELTVVVPSRNKELYIRRCLDSIYTQTYPIREVIVFDDFSTDHTCSILREYQKEHKNLTVIYSEENVGVALARERAIRQAKTDYVTFLDADDFYYDSKKLEREMKMARQVYRQTGKLCCAYSQTVLADKEGRRIDQLPVLNWDRFLRLGTVTRLYKYWLPRDYCFPQKMYFAAGGFDPGFPVYEDWDLNLRLYARCPFRFSGGYGTAYRLNTNGLSSVDYRQHLVNKKAIFKKNRHTLKYSLFESLIFYFLLYLAYTKSWIKSGGRGKV
ncbi:MAG: glycosyltransferase family A protein [Lachnospiraceae bacterium]|nr:glycosyltransferase family A protein [Lachnospiraceae bacterium]